MDHIPRSSISHTGALSFGDLRPPTQGGDPLPPLTETLDRDNNSERDSNVSRRSVSAATWTWTLSTARSNAMVDGGLAGLNCEG